MDIRRLRDSSIGLSNNINPPFTKSSWWVRFTTSSGSSMPANRTPRNFLSMSRFGTCDTKVNKSLSVWCRPFAINFVISKTITSQMCSTMSSFLRTMIRVEPLSPRKNSDGCTAVWPSNSKCAF